MMKALAAVATILMISAPTFADESVASEVRRQMIELNDAQMDRVVAGKSKGTVITEDMTLTMEYEKSNVGSTGGSLQQISLYVLDD